MDAKQINNELNWRKTEVSRLNVHALGESGDKMEGGVKSGRDRQTRSWVGKRNRNKSSLTEYLLAVMTQCKSQTQGPGENKESAPFLVTHPYTTCLGRNPFQSSSQETARTAAFPMNIQNTNRGFREEKVY